MENENLIPIDLTYFHSIIEGDQAFGKQLLGGAIADINTKVSNLNGCWEAKNVAEIKKNVHSLISVCSIAGMPIVEKWCRAIENGMADGQFHEELTPLINNIFTGWPSAEARLKLVVEEG